MCSRSGEFDGARDQLGRAFLPFDLACFVMDLDGLGGIVAENVNHFHLHQVAARLRAF